MVSTRHHPATPTSTTSSSKRTASPPPPSTRRAKSRSRKSIVPKTEEDEIKEIAAEAREKAEELTDALVTSPTTRSQTRPTRRITSGVSRSRSRASFRHTPSPASILWLIASIPLVIWDTGYVLGRPYTMPGGGIFSRTLYYPYAMYGNVDYMYGFPAWNARNGFTAAQGAMNAFETAAYIYYLYVISKRVATGDGFYRGLALKSLNVFARRDEEDREKIVIVGGSDVALAVLVCFAGAVTTVGKTVLYWLNEYFSGFANIGHNGFWDMTMWIVLNGAWIILPTYMIWVMGIEIVEGLTKKGRH